MVEGRSDLVARDESAHRLNVEGTYGRSSNLIYVYRLQQCALPRAGNLSHAPAAERGQAQAGCRLHAYCQPVRRSLPPFGSPLDLRSFSRTRVSHGSEAASSQRCYRYCILNRFARPSLLALLGTLRRERGLAAVVYPCRATSIPGGHDNGRCPSKPPDNVSMAAQQICDIVVRSPRRLTRAGRDASGVGETGLNKHVIVRPRRAGEARGGGPAPSALRKIGCGRRWEDGEDDARCRREEEQWWCGARGNLT